MNNETLITRGTVEVIVRKELEKKLKSGKKLRIKLGIDPTGSELHLGHAVVLNKLRQFQDAGHTAILLIGDYTARIGDPTGKSETRLMLTDEQIQKNMETYIEQASKVLNIKTLEIRHNSEWFSTMSMAEILQLTAKKTVNQMLQREDFKNRLKNNQDISTVELLYPLMQGYDSVMLESDIEIGGTDQLFNMLVGRDLQKAMNCRVIQHILTVPILEGLDGIEKMSKSLNNFIALTESPKEMYGKIMSIPDTRIMTYLELCTNIPDKELKELKKALDQGENPRNIKMRLAREIVTRYHDNAAAEHEEQEFINVFTKKALPEEIEQVTIKGAKWNIIELISELALAPSKSEARRLVQGGGVRVDQHKVDSIETTIDIRTEKLLQIGKRKFVNVKGE